MNIKPFFLSSKLILSAGHDGSSASASASAPATTTTTITKPIRFVTGNEAGDFDSTAGAIAYAYVMDAIDQDSHWIPLLNVPSPELLGLRGEIDYILQDLGIQYSDFIMASDAIEFSLSTDVIVTFSLFDHNEPSGYWSDRWGEEVISNRLSILSVIDHHKDSNNPSTISSSPRIIIESGSATSLLVNYLKPLLLKGSEGWERFKSVSRILFGSILLDTNMMRDKVTEHDADAINFLSSLDYGDNPLNARGGATTKRDLKNIIKNIKKLKNAKPEHIFPSSLILKKDLKSFKSLKVNGLICRWAMSTVHVPIYPPSTFKPSFIEEMTEEGKNWDYFIVISIFKELSVNVSEKKKKKKQIFITGSAYQDLVRHLAEPCKLVTQMVGDTMVHNQLKTSLSRKDIQPLIEEWIKSLSF